MILENKLNILLAYITASQKQYTSDKKYEIPRNKLNWKYAQDLQEGKFKMLTRYKKIFKQIKRHISSWTGRLNKILILPKFI